MRRASIGRLAPLGLLLGAIAIPIDPTSSAQPSLIRPPTSLPLRVVVDDDDDDDNGIADARQTEDIPLDDLLALDIGRARKRIEVRVAGPIRAILDGRPQPNAFSLRGKRRVYIQGLYASKRAGDAELVLSDGARRESLAMTAVALSFFAPPDVRLSPAEHAVNPTRGMEGNIGAPQKTGVPKPSADQSAFRIELVDPSLQQPSVAVDLQTVARGDASVSGSRTIHLAQQPGTPGHYSSSWVRLVSDTTDELGLQEDGPVLRVALRDRVRFRFETVAQDIRVGRPGDEDSDQAARRATLRVHVLRLRPGAPPVVGSDERDAIRFGREQVRIANEIWLQCLIDFGVPDEAEIRVVDPPPPTLLAIGDGDGLRAQGGGQIRLRVDGRSITPIATKPDALPLHTALDIANAVRLAGFAATVFENPPAENGAGRSADIVVQTRRGAFVSLSTDGAHPLSTDLRQRIRIGAVDLSDGVQDFDNITASVGTLEERTLVHAVADRDPQTIDLLIVNSFTSRTRQGEAFVASAGGPLGNTLLLDRNAVIQQRAAWTQAHEIGHILLDQPLHPDDIGPDRPWLLMDSDNTDPSAAGPKRLSSAECRRARRRGLAPPPTSERNSLLRRLDPRAPSAATPK